MLPAQPTVAAPVKTGAQRHENIRQQPAGNMHKKTGQRRFSC